MELVFRKYFWAVNLLFLLLVAWIAARTVNLFAETALSPLPTVSSRHEVHTEARLSTAGLNPTRVAELLGLPVPKPPTPAEQTAERFDPNAAPVKTSLRVKLLGTMVDADPRWSLCSILDLNSQDAATYMVGDKIQGAEILEIDREKVIIRNNGRREYIDADSGSGAAAPPPFAPPVRTATAVQEPNQIDISGIQSTDDGANIPRSTVDNALANLNTLAMQARIVPAFKDGQSEGFKLFSIRPDSLYSKIGIVNGDVIRRINGYDMNSPEKALEVYQKLRNSNRIEIELDRNGTIIHKTYNIQ